MYKIKLHKSFNQYCLQMCNKHNKTIIKTLKWDEIYIIKYITKSLNEFTLISTVYTSHSETVFSVIALNANLYI